MTSPRARTRAAAGPYRPVPAGRERKMLSRQQAAQPRRSRAPGCPARSIARHLRRRPTTTLAPYPRPIAAAHPLTLHDVPTILPPWFTTKTRTHDDRSPHHILAPPLPGAILTLAALPAKSPAVLTRAPPASGARYLPDPVRA